MPILIVSRSKISISPNATCRIHSSRVSSLSLVNFLAYAICFIRYKRRCVMREGTKIAVRSANTRPRRTSRSKLNAPSRVKSPGEFSDNSTCTMSRPGIALSRDTIAASVTDGRRSKYRFRQRGGFAAEVTDVFASLVSLRVPPRSPPFTAALRHGQLEEVDEPLCPAPGSVLFFRASSTSQSDTPSHSAHFSPPLCQRATDVGDAGHDVRRAEEGASPMTHEPGLVTILCPAWICSRAILTVVVTIARRRPHRYITSNIKLIHAAGRARRLFIKKREIYDRSIGRLPITLTNLCG